MYCELQIIDLFYKSGHITETLIYCISIVSEILSCPLHIFFDVDVLLDPARIK